MSDGGQGRIGGQAGALGMRGLSARAAGEALTDRQKSSVSALLESLISEVEQKLRAAIPADLAPVSGTSADLLLEAEIIDLTSFLPLFLQRTEEHRLYKAVRFSLAGKAGDLLDRLCRERKDGIGPLAKALRTAQGLRFNSFYDPVLPFADLPESHARQLVWAAAAALRHLGEGQGRSAPALDAALDAAGCRILGEHRQAETTADHALRLVKALQDRGRLDGAMLCQVAEGGEYLFVAAGLAALTAISPEAAGELLLTGKGRVTLFRAAGIKREDAAGILLALDPGEGNAAADQLERFEALSEDDARRALTSWRVDPAYRHALACLTGDHDGR